MYESLLQEAAEHNVEVEERIMQARIKGLYGSNVIWLNKDIETTAEKTCVLAEEIGHHHTTVGDILDQTNVKNRKQELLARKWAWDRLVKPENLICAYQAGCQSRYDIAEYLHITETFLDDSLSYLKSKYGLEIEVGECHVLYLDPLAVYEKIG